MAASQEASLEPLSLVVVTMAGKMIAITGLHPDDSLAALISKVEKDLDVQPGDSERRATLVHNGLPLASSQEHCKLQELGILRDTQLLCVMRRAAFQVQAGMRLFVSGAGSHTVNGAYVASVNSSSTITFHNEDRRDQRIAWYPAAAINETRTWPAGWYFEEGPVRSARGMYFQPSYSHRCLPLEGWHVYEARSFCNPGRLPEPSIELLAEA